MSDSLCIGIDLGSTKSCVSYYENGKTSILENKEGARTTPSHIFFSDKKVIVGEQAKNMADMKPEYGVYEIKRLMGKQFDDPNIQKTIKKIPFQIISDSNKPVVVVKKKTYSLVELSTYILTNIKTDVEDKLGQPIDKAVITVPASFNINQREATLRAATKAGFTVLKLMNDTTAAALSYYYPNKSDNGNYSMVYDLGGCTFDVAIVKTTKNKIETVYVDGDPHLGGHDFDNLIVNYVRKILFYVHGVDQNLDRKTIRMLKNKCEEAKKCLSTAETTDIFLDSAFNKRVEILFSRDQFENLADGLFEKTIEIVDKCLRNSQLSKSDISEVILSGGSTRIPKIQKMISDYFDGNIINKLNNLDECVAEGAGLQAALLSTHPEQNIDEIEIVDMIRISVNVDEL